MSNPVGPFPVNRPQSRYGAGPPVVLAGVVDDGVVPAVVEEHQRWSTGYVLQVRPRRVGQLLDVVQVERDIHFGFRTVVPEVGRISWSSQQN